MEQILADVDVSEEDQNNFFKFLEKKATEYMRLQRHKRGVGNSKLLTMIGCRGDQLEITKETGRRLSMRTNMCPSSSLLGCNEAENEVVPVDELIEKADGFAGVFPGIY